MKHKISMLIISLSFFLCYCISSSSAQAEEKTDDDINQDITEAQIISGYWEIENSAEDTKEIYWFEENGHFTWISSRQKNESLIGVTGYWEYHDNTLQLTTTTILECFSTQDNFIDSYTFTTFASDQLFTRTYEVKFKSTTDTTADVPSSFMLDDYQYNRISASKIVSYCKQLEALRDQNISFWTNTDHPEKNETLHLVISTTFTSPSNRLHEMISKSLSLFT
ncbi:hypothetical protein M2475_000751 [Breznakia sp. PF5-3]|uniref:hypothetical protein n=1 Tax=unclassified Breznakia TaxID=2623764 RepID=UPI0024066F26|nr:MULTISPECIES: hypothetical protein [unclassified Breznakia]MDL2276484.1 hypothetical protein [Breznakia sp. OttesenSCG-928-G09]MDF9824243.1 hypothetical protein [Breznakia sp. PM6-1]MDF9835190.1 hypothetical protein [Breznakia sp. PF5-3]MDF9837302.1 hypothetical protein [Breznakia sp. PFB2-8]MDF9859437.1 hypothetical protein [Breznakia sp. PH5-24]